MAEDKIATKILVALKGHNYVIDFTFSQGALMLFALVVSAV